MIPVGQGGQRIRGHLMDRWTDYCIACGVSRMAVENGAQLACLPHPNEVAVNHILARRRMDELFEKVMEHGR